MKELIIMIMAFSLNGMAEVSLNELGAAQESSFPAAMEFLSPAQINQIKNIYTDSSFILQREGRHAHFRKKIHNLYGIEGLTGECLPERRQAEINCSEAPGGCNENSRSRLFNRSDIFLSPDTLIVFADECDYPSLREGAGAQINKTNGFL